MIYPRTEPPAAAIMNPERPDIPDFDKPPVVEVAIALQFASITEFQTVHAGLLWELFRDRFPDVSEQLPLASAFETFGTTGVPAPSIQILQGAPVPRYWFASRTGAELLQFQPDRFIHNWRKSEQKQPYPRYESIRRVFEREIEVIAKFFNERELGSITPTQCELTYVNHIALEEDVDPHSHLERWFAPWAGRYSDSMLDAPEDAAVRMRFILSDGKGRRYGRLHVSIEPAIRNADGRPIFVFQLVARGKPWGQEMATVLATLDHQRVKLVQAFASLTTPEAHKKWGRKDG